MIVLIGCGKAKIQEPAPAEFLYCGGYFKKVLAFTKQRYSEIYILSAKYGLLDLQTVIKPYDMTLNKFTVIERKKWARNVRAQMQKAGVLNEKIIYFAGAKYREFLPTGTVPLKNLGMGRQMAYFKRYINAHNHKTIPHGDRA